MSELFKDQPEIKPVWQVIPQFFKYPFNGKVLPLLIFISLASVVTVLPLFLGFIAWLLLWAMLFKVGYEILSSTAAGMMDGPPSVTQMSDGIMFKHIGLLLAMAIAYGSAVGFTGSLVVAIGLGLFMMLALPAAIMTLAMTQSLIQALNPMTWIKIMQITGLSYLLTSVFLLLMLVSQSQAEALLLPLVGGSIMLFLVVSTFISAYFMAASFHLMGYLLYQFHEDLGIEIKDTGPLPNMASEEQTLLEEATELVKQGQADEAIGLIGQEIQRRGADQPVHDFYRRLLTQRGDEQALVQHGRDYLPALIHSHENIGKALDVAEDCLRHDSGFRPPNPGDILPLARLAFQQRRHALVLRLTSGFAKQHANHPDMVENLFLAAQSLVEHKGDSAKAVKVVSQLRRRFPDHPLAEDMARFEAGFSGAPHQPESDMPAASRS